MSTLRGDPDGSATAPGEGLWRGLGKRLSRLLPTGSVNGVAASERAYSREALQAMIERKRHNEFVRRREFDMLRKLRRAEASASPVSVIPPALFHSSIPSGPGGRATTLKKIDEIEAQMAIQWRRVRSRLAVHVPPGAPVSAASGGPGYVSRLPLTPVTLPVSIPIPDPGGDEVPMTVVGAPQTQAGRESEFLHDAQFDEAALRFAKGDIPGAEEALLALMVPSHPSFGQPEIWRVLFDFYRATGQQAPYEELAADFAQRFQRSPPQWRRLYEPPAPPAQPEVSLARAVATSAEGEPAMDWTCPPALDRQAVDLLRQTLAGLPQPWRLSWAGLVSLEPDGVVALAELVASWAGQPVKLQFAQVDCLERILDARTAGGDRSIDPVWWRLRLDWLRALRRGDEFELVALDYCVTYEVSPPAWDPPLCEAGVLSKNGETGGDTDPGAFESRLSALGDMRASDLSDWGTSAFIPPVVGELVGTLTGDAVEALARLSAHLGDVNPVIVSCGQLERIDFEAAIAIMNWVSARQAEGRTVHLTEVHRLIAALLGALGLADQAHITLRYD